MKKDVPSLLAGVGVVLLCALEFGTRMTGDGHVAFKLLDRPFSIFTLIVLAGVAIWAHTTQRILVRNMAIAGFVFVVI